VADENPSGLGAFDLPLRLPGQYFDKETNLQYNLRRDYDPAIGRYIEADPLGVATIWSNTHMVGPNHLYAYLGGNPMIYVDFEGLYKYKDDAVPRVTNSETHKSLLCLDSCTGQEQLLTSTTDGRHADPGHANGTSVDIRPTGTPSRKLFCCADSCGSPFVLDERTHSTKFGNGPHYHIQLQAPSNSSKNAIPPECQPGKC
jgi:RHS repeat-associated protein